jgi:carbonic anhydrase
VLANLAKGQKPYAAIIGCSDSRVPPELLFDAGFGELFIIRVAGNVVSPEVMGSIQYAGTHLKTQLLMVLGHEGCGAVQAALAVKFKGATERSRIQLLLKDILPGLQEIDPQLAPKEQLERAVEANVRWSMRQILETPEAHAAVAEGRAKLVGAVCEIATGRVRLLA